MANTINLSTTAHTYLGSGTDGKAFTKLVSIKDFPDLGGAPDQVEVTDLDDDQQKFLLGVQTMGAMEFTCNYSPEDYEKLATIANSGDIKHYCVAFGDTGEKGIFAWQGQLTVWVTGGGINAPREMKISISAASKVEKTTSGTFSVGVGA